MVSAETILENASNLINEEGLGMAKRGRPAKVLITKVAKTIRNKRPQTTAENIAAAVLTTATVLWVLETLGQDDDARSTVDQMGNDLLNPNDLNRMLEVIATGLRALLED